MPVSNSVLGSADRSHMLAGLQNFAGKPRDQWLRPAHPTPTGELPRSWAQLSSIPDQDIIDVLSASVPNHCIDAWSYASRAMSALLAGDAHTCRHLAYYAQLRAGLCLLANLGVGIFNRVNFIVDAGGRIRRLDPSMSGTNRGGMGTHEIVWDALDVWVGNKRTASQFVDLIKISGVSLRECLEAIWPGLSIQTIATQIVESWGLDLKRGKFDHVDRNMSSYGIQALNPINPPSAQIFSFVSETWRLFEPSSGSSFNGLDRFLLRSVLWSHHRRILGDSDYRNGPIHRRYDQLPEAIKQIASREFLEGSRQERDPALLTFASSLAKPAGPMDMLSRAFLLLRAACGFTHSSLTEAGINISAGEMRPWIDKWAEDRGFWAPTSKLQDPADLWADVELALIDLDASRDPDPPSLNEWFQISDKGLPTITEAERVAVWSLSA